MAKRITEAVELTIEGMLRSGKVTCEIASDLGVSTATVQRVRNKLKDKGWGVLWHPDRPGVVSSGIGA